MTLEAVRIRPPLEEGAELVAVHAVGPHRQTGLVATRQEWPPAELVGALRPVPGFRLPSARTDPKAEVNIVFGVKVTEPGHYGWREFDVDYRVEGRKYTARIRNGVVACGAPGPNRIGCDRNFIEVLDDRLS